MHEVDIVCYGGARGGGKSWAMALDFWLHAERYGPDAKGLMLRKTREDLKDFIDLASRMYGNAARYMEKGNTFRFTNGAKLVCAYLENEARRRQLSGLEPHPGLFRRVDATSQPRSDHGAAGHAEVGEGDPWPAEGQLQPWRAVA